MIGGRLAITAGCALIIASGVKAGPTDLPKPEIFLRAEDQERARLLGKPCNAADLANGCYRHNGDLWRELPCTYPVKGGLGSLPTDKCFKMDPPQRFRGVWIDEFEGQTFIPSGTKEVKWPTGDPKSPGWKEQFDRAQAAMIWLSIEHVKLPRGSRNGSRRKLIDFVGRKTTYTAQYGHMGMFGNEIIVDRVISVKDSK